MLPPGSLQLLVARCCLPSILEAMLRHADEPEVVGKAMVLLGVLAQGEEEVHEAIRRTLVERTPFPRIAARVLSDLWTLDGDGWAAAAGWERWGRCLPASLLHPGSQLLPRIASARCCCPVKERSGAPLCVDPCVVGPDAHDA
jgi:hypothetical protein